MHVDIKVELYGLELIVLLEPWGLSSNEMLYVTIPFFSPISQSRWGSKKALQLSVKILNTFIWSPQTLAILIVLNVKLKFTLSYYGSNGNGTKYIAV